MALKNFKHDYKDLPSENWSEGGSGSFLLQQRSCRVPLSFTTKNAQSRG